MCLWALHQHACSKKRVDVCEEQQGASAALGEGEGLREEHEERQAQLEPGHGSLAGHRKDFGCDSESERGEAGGHDLMCVSHVSGQWYALK